MINQWQEREARLRMVMKWIRAAMNASGSGEYDSAAIDKRIRDSFGMDKRARRNVLARDAERLIRGEVSMSELRGGRPREFARVEVSDIERLRDLASAIEQDMSTAKGAYINAAPELKALIACIDVFAAEYLEPA